MAKTFSSRRPIDICRNLCAKGAALALLLATAMPACAQSIAMVTDLSGKAVLQGATGKANLGILAELAPETRVQLESGARLTVIYLAAGDEYAFTGPAQIQFRSNEPQVLSGAAPQRRANPLGAAGKAVTIGMSGVAQGGFVMRGIRNTARIKLLTLSGTKTLEFSPEFRWQGSGPGIRYHFKLTDDNGKLLHEAEIEGTTLTLPAPVKLREGVSYAWELSAQLGDGRRHVTPGDFSLASAELRAQVEKLRPAAKAPVAERVLFAVWLERSELRDEARKYWRALATERPDDPGLRALAGESTHPPRTIHDITALLDQYKPDSAKVESLKAALNAGPPRTDDRIELARFYAQRAAVARELGMIDRQIADLRLALQHAEGWQEGEWDIAHDLSLAMVFAGNFLDALKLREQMHRFVRGGRGRELVNRAVLAMWHGFMGNLPEARSALRTAEAVRFGLEGNRDWSTWGESVIAVLEDARYWLLRAEGKHAQAEAAARRLSEAAEKFAEVVPRVYGAGSDAAPRLARWAFYRDLAQSRISVALMAQGRLAAAEVVMLSVLQSSLKRVGRYANETGYFTVRLAEIYIEQGRFRDAATLARAALDSFEKSGTASISAIYNQARRVLGMALAVQGRWSNVAQLYEQVRADIGSDPVIMQRLGANDVSWGLALVKTGRGPEAVSLLEAMFRLTRERLGEGHYQVAEQRGFLALALAATGQRDRALTEFQEAIKVLLARGRVDADEERESPARAWRLAIILEGYIKLLYELRDALRQRAAFDPAAEAFRVADAARGGSTQRALAASAARAAAGTPALAEMVRKEQDTRQQVAIFYELLTRMLSAPPEQQLQKVISDLRARIAELEKEWRALFADLEKRFPAYVDLINPRPATVEQTRGALKEGEALLSVLVTDDQAYVWVVPKSGPVAFHAANISAAEINRIVARLRRALDPGEVLLERFPEFDLEAASRLYSELLKPVEAAWKGAHTLMVVTNGALMQLPFGILPIEPVTLAAEGLRFDRYQQVPWLIKQLAVTQLPAVNTLVTLRALPQGNPARSPFAGFGDPQFGAGTPPAPVPQLTLRMRNLSIPRPEEAKAPVDWIPYSQLAPLPDTRDEILAIAGVLRADPQKDVFLGPAATKQNVKSADLSARRIVVFATHGLIPGDFPDLDQPALALAAPDGRSETGLLTLEEILQLKLDADWVVLSACNTAAGEGAGAEAISGLGRGFFYAGSRALLVTHWPVETRSARELVTALFERYAADPAISRAQALRHANLAVMNGAGGTDPATNRPFSYAHPIFWAPFALVGDGGR